MEKQLLSYYRRFRSIGQKSQTALHSAKTLKEFKSLEFEGKARLRMEPEEENYFSVYGEPDTVEQRKEQEDILDRLGCWWVTSESSCPSCGSWEHTDSIGMCAGYSNPLDPFENEYVIDLMAAAVAASKEFTIRRELFLCI